MCQKDTTKLSLFKISFHHLSYLSGLFGARIDFFAFGTFWLLVGTLVMAHIEKLLLVHKKYYMQECIPVGCVPPAAVAVRGGVCLGVSAQGGVSAEVVSAQGGVCPVGCLPRGVCIPVCTGQGGVCTGRVPAQGCLPREGVCPGSVCPGVSAQEGRVSAPVHAGIHPHKQNP